MTSTIHVLRKGSHEELSNIELTGREMLTFEESLNNYYMRHHLQDFRWSGHRPLESRAANSRMLPLQVNLMSSPSKMAFVVPPTYCCPYHDISQFIDDHCTQGMTANLPSVPYSNCYPFINSSHGLNPLTNNSPFSAPGNFVTKTPYFFHLPQLQNNYWVPIKSLTSASQRPASNDFAQDFREWQLQAPNIASETNLNCVICQESFSSFEIEGHLKKHQKHFIPEMSLFKKHQDHLSRQCQSTSLAQDILPDSKPKEIPQAFQPFQSKICTHDIEIQTTEPYLTSSLTSKKFQSDMRVLASCNYPQSTQNYQPSPKQKLPQRFFNVSRTNEKLRESKDLVNSYHSLEVGRKENFREKEISDPKSRFSCLFPGQMDKICNQLRFRISEVQSQGSQFDISARKSKKDFKQEEITQLKADNSTIGRIDQSGKENKYLYNRVLNKKIERGSHDFASQKNSQNPIATNFPMKQKFIGTILPVAYKSQSQKADPSSLHSDRVGKKEADQQNSISKSIFWNRKRIKKQELKRNSMLREKPERSRQTSFSVVEQFHKGSLDKEILFESHDQKHLRRKSVKAYMKSECSGGCQRAEIPYDSRIECQASQASFGLFPLNAKYLRNSVKDSKEFSISKRKKANVNSPNNIWACQSLRQ